MPRHDPAQHGTAATHAAALTWLAVRQPRGYLMTHCDAEPAQTGTRCVTSGGRAAKRRAGAERPERWVR